MKARCVVFVTAGVCAAVVVGCAGESASPAPTPRPDISGTWRNPGGQALRPAQGDVPLTPWAAERMKAERTTFSNDFRETTDPAVLYADPNGYPRILMHPMKFKLVQTDDYVYQLWEYNQNWRQIALNRSHSPDAAPAWYGNAVGKWEGDTLVVDSIGYRVPHGSIRGASRTPRTFTSSSAFGARVTRWRWSSRSKIKARSRPPGRHS